MKANLTRGRALPLLCVMAFVVAVMGLSSCGKSEDGANNVNASNTTAASNVNADEAVQSVKQAADAAQAAAIIESQRQAGQQKEDSDQATLQGAYDANPDSVDLAQADLSKSVVLTGSVKVRQGLNRSTQRYENVYMLELPREIQVTGSKNGNYSDDVVILDESYAPYVGKVASIRASLNICVTSSIASSSYSVIHAKDGYVVTLY